MNAHTFKIVSPGAADGAVSCIGTTIEMDGVELTEATGIEVGRIDAESVCTVTVELPASFVVDMAARLCLKPVAVELSRAYVGDLLRRAMDDVEHETERFIDDDDRGLGGVALRFMALLVEENGEAMPA